MSTPPRRGFEREAEEIALKKDSKNSKYFKEYVQDIALALQKTYEEGHKKALKESIDIAESGMFNLNCSAIEAAGIVRRVRDEIANAIRALIEEK